MTKIEILEIPISKPKVKSTHETKKKLKQVVQDESQVIVHCTIKGDSQGLYIRIWKSTFLFAKNSAHVSKLLHFENISLYPTWTRLLPGKTHRFTLIFQGLPKDCKHFDLIEKISEGGGFEVRNIARNAKDVYFINLD